MINVGFRQLISLINHQPLHLHHHNNNNGDDNDVNDDHDVNDDQDNRFGFDCC